MKRVSMLIVLAASVLVVSAATHRVDVVVYGGTPGGIASAVQVARMGRSVILVEPGGHLGGVAASGLGASDIGSKSSIGGFAREFFQRVYDYYLDPAAWRQETREAYMPRHPLTVSESLKSQWFFEPHVAGKILRQLLDEAGVQIVFGQRLNRQDGVLKQDGRIREIRTEGGEVYAGRCFIDATYEGDLMAAAGVTYIVGREGESTYSESLAGIRFLPAHRAAHVSPYVIAGDPSSGLLPRIAQGAPGAQGEGDHRVQAYNFRLCLTDDPENRLPVAKPDGYEPLEYELVLRHLLANPKAELGQILFKLTPMPNRKTDSNNTNLFSTDYVGKSYGWAEASYEERERILKEHQTYDQGLLWFLGNDPRVPAHIREAVGQWGLPKDEFVENGHWPHQLYVREARRMVGTHVMTQADTMRRFKILDPVALASYALDSHLVSMFVDESGTLRLEGGFGVSVPTYQICYLSLVPKRRDCLNLLVPVCLSASHAAYGSIRMEPVFMMLGQAAGAAAALAVEHELAVQDVPYETLRDHLLSAGARLSL